MGVISDKITQNFFSFFSQVRMNFRMSMVDLIRVYMERSNTNKLLATQMEIIRSIEQLVEVDKKTNEVKGWKLGKSENDLQYTFCTYKPFAQASIEKKLKEMDADALLVNIDGNPILMINKKDKDKFMEAIDSMVEKEGSSTRVELDALYKTFGGNDILTYSNLNTKQYEEILSSAKNSGIIFSNSDENRTVSIPASDSTGKFAKLYEDIDNVLLLYESGLDTISAEENTAHTNELVDKILDCTTNQNNDAKVYASPKFPNLCIMIENDSIKVFDGFNGDKPETFSFGGEDIDKARQKIYEFVKFFGITEIPQDQVQNYINNLGIDFGRVASIVKNPYLDTETEHNVMLFHAINDTVGVNVDMEKLLITSCRKSIEEIKSENISEQDVPDIKFVKNALENLDTRKFEQTCSDILNSKCGLDAFNKLFDNMGNDTTRQYLQDVVKNVFTNTLKSQIDYVLQVEEVAKIGLDRHANDDDFKFLSTYGNMSENEKLEFAKKCINAERAGDFKVDGPSVDSKGELTPAGITEQLEVASQYIVLDFINATYENVKNFENIKTKHVSKEHANVKNVEDIFDAKQFNDLNDRQNEINGQEETK